MPHISTRGRTPALAALPILLLACLGLAACGSSGNTSSSTPQTTANAAATRATATNGTATNSTTPNGTATSGTSSTGTPTGPGFPGARAGAAKRFAAVRECLSKKGITLPQRTPGGGGLPGGGGAPSGGAQLPKGMTRTQFAEALKSCGANFSGATGGRFRKGAHGFNSARFHSVLVRFAACLRQNGVNVGEPNTTGKGPIFNTKGVNTGSTKFKAAETKCRSTLLGAARTKATPGGTATSASAD
jgi:hypothetical protein